MVRSAYRLAVGQKWVTPSEFWAMAPGEFWWLVDAHTAEIDSTDYDELSRVLKDQVAREAMEKAAIE